MKLSDRKNGFTIVELLIVIVVIGILAAITIVAYNGVSKRATASAVQSELSQNAKSIMATAAINGQYSNIDIMTAGTVALKFDTTKYKVISYCSTASNFSLAVQTTAGDKFYKTANDAPVQNNAMDVFQPCDAPGIAPAFITYLNLPSACADEGGSCTFSGLATVVYGSVAQGMFRRTLNATSPFGCNNAAGDPASGYAKSCYVYPN
jgi:prepilin-type N-terminal cleavage/methylation domain-containing protein